MFFKFVPGSSIHYQVSLNLNSALVTMNSKVHHYFITTLKEMPRSTVTIRTIALILHTSKVMLKVKQQSYLCMEQEMPDVQAGFRIGRSTRDLIMNICWILECSKEFQKKVNLCLIDYSKAFECMDHENLWVALKEMIVLQYLIVLRCNLYCGWKATVRPEYRETKWFPIGKGVRGAFYLPFFKFAWRTYYTKS